MGVKFLECENVQKHGGRAYWISILERFNKQNCKARDGPVTNGVDSTKINVLKMRLNE